MAALALFWQIASLSGWLLCLIVPVVLGVLLVGQWLFTFWERLFPRLWPSRSRLLLDGKGLTLRRRGRTRSCISWDEPHSTLLWRMQKAQASLYEGSHNMPLVLACQLSQRRNVISLFTSSSPEQWRRLPEWKRFPLLEGAQQLAGGPLWKSVIPLIAPQRRAPSHRGASSLEHGDQKVLWPAELQRRRQGWAVSFDDFCAVMLAEQQVTLSRDTDD
jgi:hypothetical protein